MHMLLDNKFEKLVVALCINLAINKKNAEIMMEENRLQKFLERAFKNQDSLLMKMIHNIAMHESLKHGIVVSNLFFVLIYQSQRTCINYSSSLTGVRRGHSQSCDSV